MKSPAFRAVAVPAFASALAGLIWAAPVAQAQTDIESACTSSGGEYSSQEVRAHWYEAPKFIETCCTGAGASRQCVNYQDGVQVNVYRGS